MTGYGFLSTYPPTQCGLATFSAALLKHLTAPGSGDTAGVVRVVDSPQSTSPDGVVAQLVNGRPGATTMAAARLNEFDVAVIQHEYGIYGGRDGEDVLRVLGRLEVPSIVVLHTVLASPSLHQRQVLERIADAADATVVMSETAARRLKETYLVDPDRVVVIPHGALAGKHLSPPPSVNPFAPPGAGTTLPTVLTWGLIGPGKGIEWAVDAFGALRESGVDARYLVAGQTHPKVLERDGESYRDSLRARAATAGVADRVEFDASYRDTPTLMELVRHADIVLLPYESSEQVTSGVLIEAVAARRPVVATDFPHARELLSGGAGLLVPHRDAVAMAGALGRIITEPGLAASMSARSSRIAPSLDWSAVADRYRRLAGALSDSPARVAA